MSQRQQLDRILEIDRQIRAGLFPNAERMAAAFQVSRRVVYHDKAFLCDRLGAPIKHDRERNGWYYADPSWELPATFVSEGELVAFFLSVEVAQRYLGTAFEAPLKSAVRTLAASLGERTQVSLEQLREHYSFAAPAAPPVSPSLLVEMHRAIEEQHPARLRYYTASRDEWTDRTVDPHHLYNMRGDWYVFAYDHRRQAMRTFHLGRVAACQLLPETFERVPGFAPDEWVRAGFEAERGGEPHDVAIRFDAYQARWIRERRWHPTQTPLEALPDGGVILRFRTGALDAVKRWVLQYGGHAEVLAPEHLRTLVLAELRKALRRYAPAEG
jgi:predicted DNA-binding transcriptional regulator YafY